MENPTCQPDDPAQAVRQCFSDALTLVETYNNESSQAVRAHEHDRQEIASTCNAAVQVATSSRDEAKRTIEATHSATLESIRTTERQLDDLTAQVREAFTSVFGTAPPIHRAQPSIYSADHAQQRQQVQQLADAARQSIRNVAAQPLMVARRWMQSHALATIGMTLGFFLTLLVACSLLFGFAAARSIAVLVGMAAIAACVWFYVTTRRRPMLLLSEPLKAFTEGVAIGRQACSNATSEANDASRCSIAEAEAGFQTDHEHAARIRDESLAQITAAYNEKCSAAKEAFISALAEIRRRLAAIESYVRSRAPAWHEVATFTPSSPVALRLGHWSLSIAADQIPEEPANNGSLKFPAYLPFPSSPSLLIRYKESLDDSGIRLFQSLMLQLLCSLPPGKVRFTIIDPIGLGKQFGQFMHLADHDPSLISNRIWTEAKHIDRQLEELTEHMTLIIQKYLRGEYESITEYNNDAGEVAEPYRFLVIAGFPSRFTQAAAERLMSIASAGPACGVYVLATVDTGQDAPKEFSLSDFERHFRVIDAAHDTLHLQETELGSLLLHIDEPPVIEQTREILQLLGSRAVDGAKVEVPFAFIVPRSMRQWSADGYERLSIPIGRAGARRNQQLQLGAATAQHALIAGKTGSGKSTLLHTIITAAALLYDPDAVELYLVDFKKGVEFKPYATHGLPHARVIAIETEREFGISVLRQLDEELKRRGDLFRKHRCPDLPSLVRRCPDERCPRVLLIVDEFQEFFTEDDKLARDAALYLDRLVRQGRAFGIHVILGSQTLGGAYSLARPTLDQMAVRIALQCSEADARLVLGDDNTAARILRRPGEAIYNDANGSVEGNSLFQVAWLPEGERDEILAKVAVEARGRGRSREPIIFEGNAPAEIHRMPAFRDDFSEMIDGVPPTVWPVWLGQPTAIADSTGMRFRRQGGSNLLVVGQQEELVAGMVWSVCCSLAAVNQCRKRAADSSAAIWFVDGTPADSQSAGLLGEWVGKLPMQIECRSKRDIKALLEEALGMVQERMHADDEINLESHFLILNWVHFIRELRRGSDLRARLPGQEAQNPAQLMTTVLVDGPSVGVHTVVTCDSYTNAGRTFDRSVLREFDCRVLLQMSPSDSTALIDVPAAAKLGPYRGLLYFDDRAVAEKFTPYRLPDVLELPPTCASR